MRVKTLAVAAVGLLLALTACGGDDDDGASQAPQAEREAQFWTDYERRLGFVGTDYADPAEAKRASINLGYAYCRELAEGVDREILISPSRYQTEEQRRIGVELAEKYLCP